MISAWNELTSMPMNAKSVRTHKHKMYTRSTNGVKFSTLLQRRWELAQGKADSRNHEIPLTLFRLLIEGSHMINENKQSSVFIRSTGPLKITDVKSSKI